MDKISIEVKTIFNDVINEVIKYLQENTNNNTKVIELEKSEKLRAKLDLTLSETGVSLAELLPLIKSYLQHSVRTGSPRFFNLLFSGYSIPGILGEIVTSASNTTMHTYDVAPVATLIELELIQNLNKLIGFSSGEGLMVTGGSNANLIGMFCARHKFVPEAKYNGLGNKQLIAFVSDQAHYSYIKATNLLGIGIKNLIKVKTDSNGCMIAEQLESEIIQALQDGKTPFFVGATAGTTVLGAFDNLPSIAQVTQKYGLWLHVDGAWGAPVLFSEKHRHLLAGSELADSFTWDAHKLMGVPLICSAILVKDRGILSQACSGLGTDYLFHDDENSAYNLGEISLQCGRKVDALKFWLCWKHYGNKGYKARIERLFEIANYAVKCVISQENIELITEPCFLNICFRYIPQNCHVSAEVINQINLDIRNELTRSGQVFINYAYYKDQVLIRLILANPEVQEADIDTLFQNILIQGRNSERFHSQN